MYELNSLLWHQNTILYSSGSIVAFVTVRLFIQTEPVPRNIVSYHTLAIHLHCLFHHLSISKHSPSPLDFTISGHPSGMFVASVTPKHYIPAQYAPLDHGITSQHSGISALSITWFYLIKNTFSHLQHIIASQPSSPSL